MTGAPDEGRIRVDRAGPLWELSIDRPAKLNGFTILTRNARHFAPLGVPFLDPFVNLPPRRAALP